MLAEEIDIQELRCFFKNTLRHKDLATLFCGGSRSNPPDVSHGQGWGAIPYETGHCRMACFPSIEISAGGAVGCRRSPPSRICSGVVSNHGEDDQRFSHAGCHQEVLLGAPYGAFLDGLAQVGVDISQAPEQFESDWQLSRTPKEGIF